MTAVLHEIVTNPGLCLIIAACVAVTAFVAVAERRSREIDAAIAEDTRRIEHERQQQRAAIAKARREAAERRMRDQAPVSDRAVWAWMDGGQA
ncbi:MAG TPA: hypothetical protein VFJ21_03820 [Mycobacteriales bacterium]|nr:hypothetical protein [Mycobacteriales bacterium]